MGACQSCIGGRRSDSFDEDEENRLLYDENANLQYGSFGDAALGGENDTAEVQRESEALQRVVAKASNNMVDVFEVAPSSKHHGMRAKPPQFIYSDQRSSGVAAQYQHLVSKLSLTSTSEDTKAAEDSDDSSRRTPDVHVDWMTDEDRKESPSKTAASIKTADGDDGPLVGTFADAAVVAVS